MFVPFLSKNNTSFVPMGFTFAFDMKAKPSWAAGPGSCCGS